MKIIEKRTSDFNEEIPITFIRVTPEDLTVTIRDIINTFSDLSWVSKFDKDYIRSSFEKRAKDTADYLADSLKLNKDDSVTGSTGEYVVSELARTAIVTELNYLDIPLAELFKEQVVGNPGFDYYSANNADIIIFGDAPPGSTGGRPRRRHRPGADLIDISCFFNDQSLNAANRGEKAYAIAFSSKGTSTEKIITGIKKNKNYNDLIKYKELIFVAVNIWKM